VRAIISYLRQRLSLWRADLSGVEKVNLCCGTQSIPGYLGVDFGGPVDLKLDLRNDNLPFADNSLQVLVCISAINYFTRQRGLEIIREVHRVLRPGGVARFGVQDMEWIARRYVERDTAFFFQKLPDGQDRFEGPTLGDKFAAWFYGYPTGGMPCRYFYDFESLVHLFKTAGFSVVEKKPFRDSRIAEVDEIDNRPDQMFFLEAVK